MPHQSRIGRDEKRSRAFAEFFDRYAREIAAAVALATGDVTGLKTPSRTPWQAPMPTGLGCRNGCPDIWVLRWPSNKAIDTWRKHMRERELDPDSTVATVPDVVKRLWVVWGLEHLTPEDRMLVILRHRHGLSVDEIAVAVRKPPNTVAVALKRARRRLRNLLKETDR